MASPIRSARRFFPTALATLLLCLLSLCGANAASQHPDFPTPLQTYADSQTGSVAAKLLGRIQADPFNLVATLIFFAAIVHTFLASGSKNFPPLRAGTWKLLNAPTDGALSVRQVDRTKFLAVIFHFLG
jgi:hypothetical protein